MSGISFIEKAYFRFYKYLIAGKSNKCFYKGRKLATPKKIIFELSDKRVVHLGDSLWFEPLARFLSQSFEIEISCSRELTFYFKNLGYTVIHEISPDNEAILITSIELMYKFRKYPNVLFLSFAYGLCENNEQLIDSMLISVARFFNLSYASKDGKYQKLVYKENEISLNLTKFNLDINRKYYIFNDYMDSLSKHATAELIADYKQKLLNYATWFKSTNPEIKLIYVGSEQDKAKDSQSIGLEYIDLRGKTSVEELLILVQSLQIEGYIGFDTFLLHLFNMYDKPSYVLVKPGHSEAMERLIINKVLVPYTSSDSSHVELIDPGKW